MKQRVKTKDLLELSDKQLEKLKMAFYPPYYQLQAIDKKILENTGRVGAVEITNDNGTYVYFPKLGEFYPLPNIGQMLEFIGKDDKYFNRVWKAVKMKLGI